MEAESEIVAGYHTEYSGIRFALFFLAEYLESFAMAALAVVLFPAAGRPILRPGLVHRQDLRRVLPVLLDPRHAAARPVDQLLGFSWKCSCSGPPQRGADGRGDRDLSGADGDVMGSLSRSR